MSNITLNTFPATKTEALTILYLQQQDISNLTPAELAQKYKDVHKEIKNASGTGKKQETRYH